MDKKSYNHERKGSLPGSHVQTIDSEQDLKKDLSFFRINYSIKCPIKEWYSAMQSLGTLKNTFLPSLSKLINELWIAESKFSIYIQVQLSWLKWQTS